MGRRKAAILAMILGFTFLNAEQVEITSNDFFADENKQISEFVGNVNIKKGSYDELKANKVVVHFDKKRHTLTYEPAKQTYTVTGNGYLHEVETDKNVYGDKIVVNQKDGTYSVNSDEKKPVKFIFQIEDKTK